MPKNYKRIFSLPGTSNSYIQLYQVPEGTQSVISTLSVCNTTASAQTYRLAQSASTISSSAIPLSDNFVYDSSISSNDTVMITSGISLNQREKLMAYSSSSSTIFTAWAVEIS